MTDDKDVNIGLCVRQVLDNILAGRMRMIGLETEDVSILLSENENLEGYNSEEVQMVGYPGLPYSRRISELLTLWLETGYCPLNDLPKYDLLDEKIYVENRQAVMRSILPLLEGLQSLWSCWTQEERNYRILQILQILGKRGLLDLLGVRKTVGTVELWPPSRCTLIETFQAKHSERSQLTVGARALAKHCHRDSTNSWWGSSSGNEEAKNQHALGCVKRILDGATWINIHELPGQLPILEVRQENGYGARWSTDGETFRGFLEPQMIDGHLVGYRH